WTTGSAEFRKLFLSIGMEKSLSNKPGCSPSHFWKESFPCSFKGGKNKAMKHIFILFALLSCPIGTASAHVVTKTVPYEFGGTTFKGYLAWDDAVKGKRPGILVVHEYWGLNDYARRRTEQLAGMGYVAFAADMYGDGKVGAHPEEARAMMEAV